MNIGFKIYLKDGTIINSHDDNWKQIKDHCHGLPPFNSKLWMAYELYTDNSCSVLVNFLTGAFVINGQMIQPADKDGMVLTFEAGEQNFTEVGNNWKFLNKLNYFPVIGRTVIRGDMISGEIRFCGWKRKFGNQTIQKVCYIYPNGGIVLT
jgi:hypothetical protein